MSESRLQKHVAALQKFYGALPSPPRDPFTLFVWEIMSAGEEFTAWAPQARAIRQAIARDLPAEVDVCRRAFIYLSHHGGATCTETDPHCRVCPLRRDCPEARLFS